MNSDTKNALIRFDTKPTVMVIGFNIRPVACLSKQLGFRVIAVDFWGDLDINNCADALFTILQQKSGEQIKPDFDKPCSELLVDLAEKTAEQFREIDYILIGSGLDDRPDLWVRLRRIAPILGNSPEKLKTIRDLTKVFNIAQEVGISFPRTEKARSPSEAVEIAKNIGFPVVLKPISGSGGFRIRFGGNQEEVMENFKKVAGEIGEAWVQEYIKGIDISSSVLGNGRDCVVISVNEQLIGMTQLGASTPFQYCGNIVPLKAEIAVINHVKEVSSALGKRLGLTGSNGIDFVMSLNNKLYIMEVNPRFQATLECIKYVTGLNLVREHIKACKGELLSEIPHPKGYAVKMIVFAKEKGRVPDLSGLKYVFDISHPGVIVHKGSPVCTVQLFSESREKAVSTALKTVSEIHERFFKFNLEGHT